MAVLGSLLTKESHSGFCIQPDLSLIWLDLQGVGLEPPKVPSNLNYSRVLENHILFSRFSPRSITAEHAKQHI